ncbi:MAG: pitrilysin family protein [Steroidobacteraceae bacterium]
MRHPAIRRHAWVALLLAGGAACANFAGASPADQSQRSQVAGIDLVTYRTDVKDVVVILGSLPAGDAMAGSSNISIPTLTGMMLDRGTATLDKFAIAEKLDDVGAEIAFSVGTQSLEIRAKCLKKDLPLVMGLIAEELRTPALQLAEFNKAKQQFIGALEASAQNTEARAQEAFDRAVFPAAHPNHPHTVAEFETAAKAASLDELKAFHAKYYGPAHMTLVVVGDVDAPGAQGEVGKAFAGWSGGQDYVRPAAPAVLKSAREISVPLADKPSVTVIIGQPTGLRYKDPDALALRVGTAILGSGFTGRLMGIVRDKEGLTYNIGAGVSGDSIVDGSWDISASFAPALLQKGIASTRRELDRWWKEGVTEQELAARKQGLVGGYLVGLSTTGGLAGTLLTDLQRGYGVSRVADYPGAVKALTLEEVNSAIRKHLNPGDMVTVEAGSVAAAH